MITMIDDYDRLNVPTFIFPNNFSYILIVCNVQFAPKFSWLEGCESFAQYHTFSQWNIIEPTFSPIESNSFRLEIHCQVIHKKGYKSFHFSWKCPDCNGCPAQNHAKYFALISLTILEEILTRNCFVYFLILYFSH